MPLSSEEQRCDWAYAYPEYLAYHDRDWGRPVHDDRLLFEMLALSGVQAGLNWIIVLRKREGYRRAFDGFDIAKVAAYDEDKINALLLDEGIIRNRQKIRAIVNNARAIMRVIQELGSFDAYLWGFVDGRPIDDLQTRTQDVPARTELSDRISADMKKRGFKFAGSTIVCAFMHMAGLMNGHSASCLCRAECGETQ